jgi:hypothetical protein
MLPSMGKLYRPSLRAMSRKTVTRKRKGRWPKRDWYDYAMLAIAAVGLALAFYVAYSSGILSERL